LYFIDEKYLASPRIRGGEVTVREFLGVNYGDLGKAEKWNPVRLGGLRKAFQIMQRQLCWCGRRELGYETGEEADSPFTGREIGRKFGEGKQRRRRKRRAK